MSRGCRDYGGDGDSNRRTCWHVWHWGHFASFSFILYWFCKLAYLLLSTSGRERHCVVRHCHHGSRVGAQDMYRPKHLKRAMVSPYVVIVIALVFSDLTYGALLLWPLWTYVAHLSNAETYTNFSAHVACSQVEATEDEDPLASAVALQFVTPEADTMFMYFKYSLHLLLF